MGKLTYGDLFSGGGLMAIGAQMAGFDVVFGVEKDPSNPKASVKIQDCYDLNISKHSPNHTLYRQTVQETDMATLPYVDWFHSSPVCKNFSPTKTSAVGKQFAEASRDLEMAQAVCDYICIHRPQFVSIENVPDYVHSESWCMIEACFAEHGYGVTVHERLNSADYGVPQRRIRMIVTAVRDSFMGIPLPMTHAGNQASWDGAIMDLFYQFPKMDPLYSALNRMPMEIIAAFTGTGPELKEPALISRSDLVNSFGGKAIRPTGSGLPGKTVIAIEIRRETDREGPIIFVGRNFHRLNVRALARIQSVPDWYVLPSDLAEGNKAVSSTIVGNGVPCLLAKHIGEKVRELKELL